MKVGKKAYSTFLFGTGEQNVLTLQDEAALTNLQLPAGAVQK